MLQMGEMAGHLTGFFAAESGGTFIFAKNKNNYTWEYFAIRQAIAAEMKSAMEYLVENTKGLFIVVPKGGIEPPWDCSRRILSPVIILHNCFILLNKFTYKKYAYVKIQPLTVLCIISKVTFYFCFH